MSNIANSVKNFILIGELTQAHRFAHKGTLTYIAQVSSPSPRTKTAILTVTVTCVMSLIIANINAIRDPNRITGLPCKT